MVLNHVAQGAGPVVVVAAGLDARLLGDRDLHMIDEVAVPQRLDHQVGEAEHQQVLHGLLRQVVVDAVDLVLVEVAVQKLVQRLRTLKVCTEGFLHHEAMQPARAVQSDRRQILGHRRVVFRLDRQVEHDVGTNAGLWSAQGFEEAPEPVGVTMIAAHVIEPGGEPREALWRELPREFRPQRALHVRGPVGLRPLAPGERDEVRDLRQPAFEFQAIQRRQQLGRGQVPGRAEDHEAAGIEIVLGVHRNPVTSDQ